MNTFKFLNNFSIDESNFQASMNSLRSKFYEAGVCWTDDVQGKFDHQQPFRVVLYTKATDVNFKNPMVKECNGLVIEYNQGWRLLAMPPRAFCTNKVSMKKINDLYLAGSYEVYEVLDATILTLYFYQNSWRLSSTKGYDLTDVQIMDGMTYMEALQDLMNTKYCSFTFESLNKNYSYTIALRHSKYHIFDETKHLASRTRSVPREGVDMNSYIMVMSVADLQTMYYVSKYVAGLPRQSPITIKDSNVNLLISYARSAYAKYEKAYRLQNFKYKPLYGYILRAKNRSVPNDCSTIYIESELYKSMRSILYKNNDPLRKPDHNQLVINMSMNHDRYEQFKIMFNQFEDKFNKLEAAVDRVASDTVLLIIGENKDHLPQENIELVNELVETFKNHADITTGLIKDAMYSKRFSTKLIMLIS